MLEHNQGNGWDRVATGNRTNNFGENLSLNMDDRIVVLGTLLQADLDTLVLCLSDGRLEKKLPDIGIKEMVDVDQGTKKHLEGPVHVHVAHVIVNLRQVIGEMKQDERFSDLKIDDIDQLAALIHDVKKATTRVQDGNGNVSFPGHEEQAKEAVEKVADLFALTKQDEEKLMFLVTRHGDAHNIHQISDDTIRKELVLNEHWANLVALQRADARSCWLSEDGSKTNPEHTETFIALRKYFLSKQ